VGPVALRPAWSQVAFIGRKRTYVIVEQTIDAPPDGVNAAFMEVLEKSVKVNKSSRK
jgi:hypothetical protein